MESKKFPLLFAEGRIGEIRLKNRLVMAPMGTNYGSATEAITAKTINHYVRRAQGGIGLIVTESCPVEAKGVHGPDRIKVYNEDALEGLTGLAEAVHRHDGRLVLQLTHGGSKCAPDLIGQYPAAPSSQILPGKDYIPRTLAPAEIEDIVDGFVAAALVAKKAGFDGIQLLAASGHLIHEFLSPVSNERTDAYGGSIDNRARFMLEIVHRIRKAAGEDFPILVKLYGKDPGNPKGTALPEADLLAAAGLLVEAGVCALHLSTNHAWEPLKERAAMLQLAKKIKQQNDVKISLAGSIFEASVAEQILAGGSVDFIEIGRQILADPDLANKLAAGLDREVRPCLDCNLCRHLTHQKQSIKCTVNPYLAQTVGEGAAGSVRPRNVAVIGGGPAGMQAAIHLAHLGHRGTVFEKDRLLGGLLRAGSAAPGKERIGIFLDYLLSQFEKSGFAVEYNRELTLDNLAAFKLENFDAIILANGAAPYIPKPFRQMPSGAFLATDVLSGKIRVEGKPVILGAGQAGCETADYLSENGKGDITVLAAGPTVARHIHRQERIPVLKRLGQKGVKILINASFQNLSGHELTFLHNGREEKTACDAVIIAKGWEKNGRLKEEIAARCKKPVYLIGDAVAPRSICEAVAEGTQAAAQIGAR